MVILRLFFCIMAALTVAAKMELAQAKNRALLIGVADYTGKASESFKDLYGPRNDVTMMWRFLAASKFAAPGDIHVLSDGLPAGTEFPVAKSLATYAAILAELDDLARQSYSPQDWVVIYYSGHGTRAPDADGDPIPEAGGMDSVLMPSDTGVFDPATGKIENALVDDELGRKIDAIRARGANVWAIIDSCHSGSGTRGDEGFAKSVNPALLGVPGGSTPAPTGTRGAERIGSLTQDMPAGPGRGRFVGYYAVDPFNLAWELPYEFAAYQMPVVPGEKNRQRMSVFTQALHSALTLERPRSFADLFQETLSIIAANPRTSSKPRPVSDGELTGTLPWSTAGSAGPPAFFERGYASIAAGAFHGFDKGARIGLHDGETLIAEAEIIEATPVNSVAGHVKWLDGKDHDTPQALTASLLRTSTSMAFTIAKPAGGGPDIDTLFQAAFSEGEAGKLGIGVVAADDLDANLLTRIEGNMLYVLRRGEVLVPDADAFGATIAISLADPENAAAQLKDTVWKLSRAERLVRAAANGMSKGAKAQNLSFVNGRFREDGPLSDPRKGCSRRANANGKVVPLDDEELEELDVPQSNLMAVANCDMVMVAALNLSYSTQYYIGAFYVQADGAIIALHPITGRSGAIGPDSRDRCAYPLPPQQDRRLHFEVQVGTWDAAHKKPFPIGLERVVLLAVRENSQRMPPDLCGLQQGSAAPVRDVRGSIYPEIDALIGGVSGWGLRGEAVRGAEMAAEMESYYLELDLQP